MKSLLLFFALTLGSLVASAQWADMGYYEDPENPPYVITSAGKSVCVFPVIHIQQYLQTVIVPAQPRSQDRIGLNTVPSRPPANPDALFDHPEQIATNEVRTQSHYNCLAPNNECPDAQTCANDQIVTSHRSKHKTSASEETSAPTTSGITK